MLTQSPEDLFSAASEGDVNTTCARAEWQTLHIDAPTRALLDEDARWFLHQSLSTPCLNVLTAAQGSWLTDSSGRQILDFHGNSLHQVGYGHPRVRQAISDALERLPFSPRRYTNPAAIDLARRLCQASPVPDARLLFAPGGTAAIGMAIKLARMVTGRHKTLSMWDSFHGASLDAISLGGEALFRQGIGPLMPGCEHVPPYDPHHCVMGCAGQCALRCADYVEYCLRKEGDVGAVVIETIRSTDVQVPPHDYYQRIHRACQKHGALLILDEIPIALGRTGHLFAAQRYGIEPDMLVLGKGLGGGSMPLAALIAQGRFNIAAHVALGHYTHEKSPVACAAGLAVLDVLDEESLIHRSLDLGRLALNRLRQATQDMPAVREVRGAGLLIGIELASPTLAQAVLYRCLSQGLSFKVGQAQVLVLAPPLNVAEADLWWALDVVLDNVRTLSNAPENSACAPTNVSQ